MKPVIDYEAYRKSGQVENKHPDGFWFDMDQFENTIDAWCSKEEVMTILQSSEKELDKFCNICYGHNFQETYNILIAISRMYMKKSYDTLAKMGNASAINLTAKHFVGLKDDNDNDNKPINVVIKNDLK